LFLAFFVNIIINEEKWSKYRLLTPAFFVIWANIHGGYVAGLVSFFLVIVARAVSSRRFGLVDVGLFVASALSTVINPYFFGSWREVWSSVSDTSIRWTVLEWLPSLFNVNFALALYITLSLTFVFKYRKKISLEELFLYGFFFIQAMLSSRNVPLWIVVSLPITNKALLDFVSFIKKQKIPMIRLRRVYIIIWAIAVFLFIIQASFAFANSLHLKEEVFYPAGAVEYFKGRTPAGNVFSMYGWGGYLIWKYPEKKVYIDGRMPSWKWEANINGEENNAYETYQEILSGEKEYKHSFEKYHIDTVLWPKPKTQGVLNRLSQALIDSVELLNEKHKRFDLLTSLEKDGWSKIYDDNASVIYQKND
jgi:hypothetical protein